MFEKIYKDFLANIDIPILHKKGVWMNKIEWCDIFSDNLRELMSEHGYNQAQLSEETGITQSTISGYLNKKIIPSATAVVNIAYVLDCAVEELIDFGDTIE